MKRIPVYDRSRLHGYAVVDDEFYDELVCWLWKVNPGGYACRNIKGGGSVRMHRQIMGLVPGDGFDVDHINHDILDNRRENLRVVTRAQNLQNRRAGNKGARSPYRGVSFCKQTGRWSACVVIDRQMHWLGRHDTEEQAAAVASAFRAKHMPYSEDARALAELERENNERKAA